jgi:transcription-repair coupling factor (superfamily II helicase)
MISERSGCVEGLLKQLCALEEVRETVSHIESGDCPVALTGLSPVHRSQIAAAVHRAADRPLVAVCADEKEAKRLVSDLAALTGETPVLLPDRELQLHAAVQSRQWEHQRLGALYRLCGTAPAVVVATVDALMLRCMPRSILQNLTVTLRVGAQYELDELVEKLLCAGYERCGQVEGPGQFALRGGILDVFSPEFKPVRCEFFDNEIDSLGVFDITTQRRYENIEQALLLPAAEVLPFYQSGTAERTAQVLDNAAKRLEKKLPANAAALRADAEQLRAGIAPGGVDRYAAAVYPQRETAMDYLAGDSLIFFSESARVSERCRSFLWQLKEDCAAAVEGGILCGELADFALTESEFSARLEGFPVLLADSLPTSRYLLPPRALMQISAKQLSTYGGSLDAAVNDLEHYTASGYRVLVLCGSERRGRNLQDLLYEKHISAIFDLDGSEMPDFGQVQISLGALSAGCEYPQLRLAILTEGQMTAPTAGKAGKIRQPKSDPTRQKLQSYTDLTPGDLVVHLHHGIGRFVGIIRMPVDGVEKDYIKIAYAGSDCLYVPATSLDLVSKYIGSGDDDEGHRTRLNKLGGTEWAKATSRAKAAARDLAKGLIQLYAQRQRQGGYAFSPDSPWQQEFEDAFPYEEMPDQLRCIQEIKADMEKNIPMDRLLCGDVGYGKTEVALRAVMKCVLDGKQAAILVPTTVLAQQHYATALSRFRAFPVQIEMLSRFRSPRQVKEILEATKEGRIDLLIGTHKLLGANVQFKNLGLLIVDEEQRFGVTHKEKLRQRAAQVDTLTLSATPIPRTLNMALSGIRDMSTIESPPQDRQVVQTYVLEHEWPVLLDAIRRELARGGQVYYLHNRVETIDATASRLRQMLGDEVSIAVGHGKMAEGELGRVMQQMADGEVQILVCTTIIETGIDIPNVNTLIIEDADRMGLSQLHQIRGRIGRSSRRAYAYLTYRRGKVLTEVATKRLTAVREYVAFGSGFKIAMRDLEIRGAGNLLGPEQSGYMMSVGYDMYLRLLEDAVLEQQGQSKKTRIECSADLTVAAHIPENYVAAAEERMDLYRRIAAIRSVEDSADVMDELIDRYGEPPRSVLALLDVALLRAGAAAIGFTDITQRGRNIVFSFGDTVDATALMQVCSAPKYRGRLLLSAGENPHLTLRLTEKEDALDGAGALLEELRLHARQE